MDGIRVIKRSVAPLPDSTEIEMTNMADEKKYISCTTTTLYNELRSLLFSCSLGGLIFKKDFNATGIKKYLHVTHVYSIIILIFMAINVLRWFTMFRGDEAFGSTLFFHLLECIWGLESIGHYLACFIACESYNRLPEFFVEWDKLPNNTNPNLTSMKKLANFFTTLLGIFICIHLAVNTYLLFWTDVYEYFITPWDRDFQYALVIEIIGLIFHGYITFAWFVPSILMFVICRAIACRFNLVTREVIMLSQVEFVTIEDRFEGIRRRHQQLCNIVARADNIFSMHIAISLPSSVIIACFLMYNIAYDGSLSSNKTLSIVIEFYWLGSVLSKLIFDCISGAILNDAVSSLVPRILTYRLLRT